MTPAEHAAHVTTQAATSVRRIFADIESAAAESLARVEAERASELRSQAVLVGSLSRGVPGDVAMVSALNRREHRAYFDGFGWREYGDPGSVTVNPVTIRFLVVTDPEHGAVAESAL